jgi:plastocyanin
MMEYYENYEESYGWPSHGSWMGYWGPMMGYMGIYPQFNRTAQQPESAEVIIRGFMYHPQVLRVQKGATVTWTNLDPTEHTITFEGGLEDSGPIAYGQSFSYTFDEEGKYYYSCTLHPYTIGAIIVRG